MHAVIRIAPMEQYLLLIENQSAAFFCQAVGVTSYWSVNGTTVERHGNYDLKARGVLFTSTEQHLTNPVKLFNMTISLPSSIEFNNTEIRCVAVIHQAAVSQPVSLVVNGMTLIILCMFSYYSAQNNATDFSLIFV